MSPKFWHVFTVTSLAISGCDTTAPEPVNIPSQVATSANYRVIRLDDQRNIIEINVEGRKHIFLESWRNPVAKIGDYPITKEK